MHVIRYPGTSSIAFPIQARTRHNMLSTYTTCIHFVIDTHPATRLDDFCERRCCKVTRGKLRRSLQYLGDCQGGGSTNSLFYREEALQAYRILARPAGYSY